MRLFTFGCSHTSYHYPTWADIIGRSFTEFYNWGRPGAGNNYILNAINRCHLTHKFRPDDTVIILWSGLARIDYYQINEWSHFVNQYFDLSRKDIPLSCPVGYQWLSFAWMASVQYMLDYLKINYKMLHWQEFDGDTEPYKLYGPILDRIKYAPMTPNQKPYRLHPQSLKSARQLYDRMAGASWPPLDQILDGQYRNMPLDAFVKQELYDFCDMIKQDRTISSNLWNTVDMHPSPLQHLAWVNEHLPEYPVSPITIDWITDIDSKLSAGKHYDFDFKHF